MKKIKKILIKIRDYWNAKKYFNNINVDSSEERIIIFSTPIHRNIGDQAIILAELQYLKDKFDSNLVIEVPRQFTNYFIKNIEVRKNDLIMIHGGGFFGNIYPVEAENFLKVIKEYSNNSIIVFPQTMYIDDKSNSNEYSHIEFKNIIGGAKDITFFARENASFSLASDSGIFTKVYLVPDIVMYLERTDKGIDRDGILFVYREDSENTRTFEVEDLVRRLENDFSYSVRKSSTMSDTSIFINEREGAVDNKLMEFSQSKLIITDRLHGMIFAYLTNTPCIAIDNMTKKSSGVYHAWFKGIENISLLEGNATIDQICAEVNILYGLTSISTIDQADFNILTQVIRSKI